jgi:ribosome-binding protein aMBF1 (putative translation factor)
MNSPARIQAGASVWRKALQESGLTQREIAKALSMSQSNVSKIGRGLLVPDVLQWYEFAKITGVPTNSYALGFIPPKE